MRVLQIKRLKQAFRFYYAPYSQLLFSYIEKKPLVVIMAKGFDLHTLQLIKKLYFCMNLEYDYLKSR